MAQQEPSKESVTARLLTAKEAATKLSCSQQFLERDRATGRHGIPFVAFGSRSIRYREADLDRWVEKQLVVVASGGTE